MGMIPMLGMEIGPRIIVKFGDSGFYITETAIFAVAIAVILVVLAIWSTRKMEKIPRGKQFWAEFVVSSIYRLVEDSMGKGGRTYAPYIGSLFCFLLVGSMLGLFGLRPVTADVNTTAAVAFFTFILIQYTAIKHHGVKGKLKEMCDPYPFMFPLKIIEQVSFPVSLALRIFGNILAGYIVVHMLLNGLGSLSDSIGLPIPIFQTILPLPANLFFDVFEPMLQSFIFIMLTMVFISMEMVMSKAHEEH